MPHAVFLPIVASVPPAQSALQAHGDAAMRILEVMAVLFAGGAVIFAGVVAATAIALRGPRAWRDLLGREAMVVGAGIVFPAGVLLALLAATLGVAPGWVPASRAAQAPRIQVTGEMWWWRVRYLDGDGRVLVETANEIRIPAGRPVDLALVSDNLVHSFWVPSLAGKVDMVPGKVNRLRLHAAAPGVFRGRCAEFCGAQHAKMAFDVVAQPPQEHAAWLQAQRAPAAPAEGTLALRGQALFAQARCGVCHTVRGTPADGTRGPDLTHVGSRLSLAAGTLPNGPQALQAWIAGTQHLKPGSLMPAYRLDAGDELPALAAYLEGLR